MQIERCCEMVLARGNREPSQALTGAALSGVLLCEYHFVTASFAFGLIPQLNDATLEDSWRESIQSSLQCLQVGQYPMSHRNCSSLVK